MKAIFAEEFRSQDEGEVLEMILERVRATEKDEKYVEETLRGVMERKEAIWEVIKKYAPERPVSEINPANRAILMLGIYEIKFVGDDEVPPVVAINEAIEVAREMSNEAGIAFVNGVLNKVFEDLQKENVRS